MYVCKNKNLILQNKQFLFNYLHYVLNIHIIYDKSGNEARKLCILFSGFMDSGLTIGVSEFVGNSIGGKDILDIDGLRI